MYKVSFHCTTPKFNAALHNWLIHAKKNKCACLTHYMYVYMYLVLVRHVRINEIMHELNMTHKVSSKQSQESNVHTYFELRGVIAGEVGGLVPGLGKAKTKRATESQVSSTQMHFYLK